MSDAVTAAALAAISTKEAQRLSLLRCADRRCRLAGVFRVRGTVVYVTFGRKGTQQASFERPDEPVEVRCRCSVTLVRFTGGGCRIES